MKNTTNAVVRFLTAQGCTGIRSNGTTTTFTTPNGLAGCVVKHGTEYTEVIDGTFYDHKSWVALKRSWKDVSEDTPTPALPKLRSDAVVKFYTEATYEFNANGGVPTVVICTASKLANVVKACNALEKADAFEGWQFYVEHNDNRYEWNGTKFVDPDTL